MHTQVHPRSNLILAIQRESKQLQALERENRDLRITLNDYANALELIMSKYRQQVSQLIQSNVHHAHPHLHHAHHAHGHHQHHAQHISNSSQQSLLSTSGAALLFTGGGSQTPQHAKGSPKSGSGGSNSPARIAALDASSSSSQDSPVTVKRLAAHSSNTHSPNTTHYSSTSSLPITATAAGAGGAAVTGVSLSDCLQRPDVVLINKQRDKIMEMAAVMMKAVELDEKDSLHQHELLVQLRTENEGLRQMLAITRQNGNNLLQQQQQQQSPAAVADDRTSERRPDEPFTGSTATMIPKRKTSSAGAVTTASIAVQTDDSS